MSQHESTDPASSAVPDAGNVGVGLDLKPGELAILMATQDGEKMYLSNRTVAIGAIGGIDDPALDLVVRRRASEMLEEIRRTMPDDPEDQP